MITEIIAYNIKYYTKKRGFKITVFIPDYLNCTYHGFNWRLSRGRIYLSELVKIMQILDVTFDDLIKKPKGFKSSKTASK